MASRSTRILRRASPTPIALSMFPGPAPEDLCQRKLEELSIGVCSLTRQVSQQPEAIEAPAPAVAFDTVDDEAMSVDPLQAAKTHAFGDLEMGFPISERSNVVSTIPRWSLKPRSLEFDARFTSELHIRTFNPKTQGSSDLDLVFTLGRVFGPGLTRTQFRQIMRRCALCHNVCFRMRRHSHKCQGTTLQTQEDGFDFVQSLLTFDEHSGFNRADLSRLLTRCSRCKHICLGSEVSSLHDCVALKSI
ncbi:hypothetical protein NMY22_g991 [Coprinellus aureogranulatus]|nr:hypothetical protein NMY22_g991 [Coprinellus aureogranulatus]